MDRLDLPKNPKYPPILIPYVATQVYDEKDFETYVDRHGWRRGDVEGADLCVKSLDERASFVQTWLFFGLLASVFGDKYSDRDWVHDSDSDGINVTLFELQNRLDQSYPRDKYLEFASSRGVNVMQQAQHREFNSQTENHHIEQRLNPDKDTSLSDPVGQELRNIFNTAHETNLQIMHQGPYNHNLDLVCLSVAALGETLTDHFCIFGDNLWLAETPDNYLFRRLLDNGWCPMEILKMKQSHNVGHFYYLSNIDRPGPTRNHQRCRDRINLRKADQNKSISRGAEELARCSAYDLNWQTYKTEHVKDCSCVDLKAKQSDLEIILEAGHFPLILPASQTSKLPEEDSHSSECFIPVVSTQDYPRYVCISHVWSDGLGNPHENALPRCQYYRLSAIVRELCSGERVPFWIDTICVPREPIALRRRSIMLMRKTYWDAEAVLVLDKYLLGFDPQTSPEKEFWWRVRNCGWMRRLWTLQESALAKRVIFCVRNEFIDLDRAMDLNNPERDILTLDWLRLRGLWERWSGLQSMRNRSLSTVGAAVAWRSTSIAEDEAICLAILNNFDAASLEKILLCERHEDRMIQFWKMKRNLSADVLFWAGPRIQTSPLRWAPSSFLGRGMTTFLDFQDLEHHPAELSEFGLRCSLPGLHIGRWTYKFRHRMFLVIGSNSWYALASDLDNIEPPAENDNVELAIMLQKPISMMSELLPGNAVGVLIVAIQRPKDESSKILSATPVCVGAIQEASEHLYTDIRLLALLRARALEKYSLSKLTGVQTFNGAEFGHRNSSDDTTSDMIITVDGESVRVDLKEQHTVFSSELTPEQQEWCIS